MKKIIVAPVGEYIEDIYVGIREFPTEKVILITPKDMVDVAKDTQKSLEKFKVPAQIIEIKGNLWEEMFKVVARIKEFEKGEIIVNVSTGGRDSRCAATSAAFVNGFKAFAVENNETMLLPTLKFSYYNILTDKKMNILQSIEWCTDCTSMEDLAKSMSMSLPLVSYHINGTLKAEGLKQLGLVQTKENKGKVEVTLTSLGRMLLKGYVSSE
jgi:hypothetical protein